MSNKIEIADRSRSNNLKGFLIGGYIFILTWFAEQFLQYGGYELQSIRRFSLPIFIISILIQAFFSVRLVILKNRIRTDQELSEALYNELVRLNELKSWRFAFFVLVVYNLIFGVVSTMYASLDFMYVALTSAVVGFVSYHSSFFHLDRG